MANFRYQVLDAAGKQSSGVIDAQSIADASRKLKAEGRYVLKVELDKGPGLMNLELGSKKLNTKELVLISRQLSSLLSAGITIVRSLDMLYQQMETKRSKKCVGEIYESIQQGKTLSEAFRDQRDILPSIMISMISAGEESGRLDEIMARLAEHFQKESKLKNKISSALVYPKILAFVTVAITVGLMTFLVPGIAETIIGLGGELPALTKAIMAISNSLVHFWYVYIIIIGSIVFGFNTWKKSDKGSITWAKIMLDMPIVGKATKMTAAARFCRMVSTLLKSGISVLSAIEITSASLDNKILEKKLNDARLEIRKGTTLSKSIKGITEFPPMIYAMTAIGEESGTLDAILEKAADFFEDEADAATTKMVTALEPCMLVIMAIVVGLTVGGIALPIFTMAQYIM
ncbi:type IV pilus assembly protein PilC [Ruminococcaceae bacterium KH2T8]|nr:type IV pilus assembly protein PilC [Ruminococcaceae bacterium KH2T8]